MQQHVTDLKSAILHGELASMKDTGIGHVIWNSG
jgi:hypothetical protein